MFVHAIELEAKKILGTNDDRVLFRSLTQAVQSLMERGHWFHTQARVDICSGWDGCTLTLPKGVGVPLAVNTDGSPSYFRSRYFEFHANGGGQFSSVPWAWDDRGQTPVMMDPKAASELVAVAQLESDAGKMLRVLGTHKGVEIQGQTPAGVTVPGLYVPIQAPWNLADGVPLLPNGVQLDHRDAAVARIFDLFSDDDSVLELVSGAAVQLSIVSGSVDSGFAPRPYFIQLSEDGLSVRVFSSRLAALNGVSPVSLNEFSAGTILSLRDSRAAVLRTQLQANSPHGLTGVTAVTLTATTLPPQLRLNVVYFVAPLEDDTLQLFLSRDDAETGRAPVYAESAGSDIIIRPRRELSPTTLLRGPAPHNLVTGDAVLMNNDGGTLPEPLRVGVTYYARVITADAITVHLTQADALSGNAPVSLLDVGTGVSSFFKLIPCTAAVGTSNNLICPGHNLPLNSDTLVRVVSEGTFPTPLNGTTAYYVNPGGSVNTLTIKSSPTTAVDITAVGAGNLYVAVSRTFSVIFDDSWATATADLVTGNEVFLATDAFLPVTTPSTDSNTPVYVRAINLNRVELYDTEAHAEDTGATTGRISIISLGAGQAYLERPIPSEFIPLDSTFKLDSVGYLFSGVVAQFETDGTLPSPLIVGDDYRVTVLDDGIEVRELDDTLIVITDVGLGSHRVVIDRSVEPRPATQLVIQSHKFNTGTEVVFADEPPVPLTPTESWFVRWISSDMVELYDTEAHAKNLASTAGRVSFYVSDGIPFSAVRVSAPVLVDCVTRVDKPVTVGSITLYAWDPRNSSDLTLLGTYGPMETCPSYRRVRLGKPCAWVRLLYRVEAPIITSREDYIPIEQERAVLMALRALDLENKNFLAQAMSYWEVAVRYLLNQHESVSGHAAEPPQIQSHGYGADHDEFLV